MRRLKYYVACSIDGFIAREDGSLDDFPTDPEHVADFFEALRSFDVVLMGRKTYEVGLRAGVTNPYPAMKQYVFSRTLKQSPDPNIEIVTENAAERVKALRNEPGKDIWLCGGGDLATTLFTADLIDEIILKVNPLLLGSGIPFFSGDVRTAQLELSESKIYRCGVAVLHYQAKR